MIDPDLYQDQEEKRFILMRKWQMVGLVVLVVVVGGLLLVMR